MKKMIFFTAALLVTAILFSCKKADSGGVIIYTSTEDFRTEHMQGLLAEKFPNYDITLQVLATGNHAAKIKAEGTATEADIILNLETGYLEGLQDVMADLSSYNLSEYLPELVPASKKYLPWDKSSGAIVINREKLQSLGLPLPATY
jgi:iron(III) transport system substrate-binding protein